MGFWRVMRTCECARSALVVIPAREADERLVNSRGEAGDINVHEHVGLLPSGHREVPMFEVWSHPDGGRKLINRLADVTGDGDGSGRYGLRRRVEGSCRNGEALFVVWTKHSPKQEDGNAKVCSSHLFTS